MSVQCKFTIACIWLALVACGPWQRSMAAVTLVLDQDASTPPRADFELLSDHPETYLIRSGAQVYTNDDEKFERIAPEHEGLIGIRVPLTGPGERVEPVRIFGEEPVHVLIGYFDNDSDRWLQPPTLEINSQAARHGGIEAVIGNAVSIPSRQRPFAPLRRRRADD
ncbi:MAG TPA: hypothetical protein VKA68_14165 [bacterium]|nr:hypothetical protein [bacterium]